ASISWSARHAVTAFNNFTPRIGLRLLERTRRELELSENHLELVLKSMRDDLRARNIPLVVSVLPFRGAMESAQPRASVEWQTRGRFVEMAQHLNLPVLDPWDDLERVVGEQGSRKIFISPPDWDVHFTPEGHRHYARWLLQKLGPGLRQPPDGQPSTS